MSNAVEQLGFDALLRSADDDNRSRALSRAAAHLPATMEQGIPYYRFLIRQHHAAMLAADVDEVMRLREEAHLLAVKLNGGNAAILMDETSAGLVLERETAAGPAHQPLWGQSGCIVIEVAGMRLCAAISGMLGIGSLLFWPGFEVHAVDLDKPFLSETGYRSFIGVPATPVPGLLPGEFVERVVNAHVNRELKGRLVLIDPRYRAERR